MPNLLVIKTKQVSFIMVLNTQKCTHVVKLCIAMLLLGQCMICEVRHGDKDDTNGDVTNDGNQQQNRSLSSYKSVATFDPKGMEFLYQATNFFLDVLVLNKEFPGELC